VKLAAPLIIAAHVAKLPTLPGWTGDGDRPAVTVYEGARTDRSDTRRYVTVGFVSGDDGPAVHSEPETTSQGQNREAGSIASNLVVTGPDVATARGAAFDLLASWAAWLATDRTMPDAGGQAQLLPQSTASLVFDVVLTTTRAGATASAIVTVTYTAHTYG
jgi:hypothetical protein